MLEAAYHVVNKKQKYLSVHAHGLVWGDKEIINSALTDLPRGIGDAPGGTIVECDNREGWLIYVAKDLRCRSIINQNESGKWLRPMSEQLTRDDQLTLIEALGDLTKPELTFATGVGVGILKAARKAAKEQGYVKSTGNQWAP